VTSSAVSNDLADFGVPDEHLHESITASSLDSKLIKSPSPIRFDFSEMEILKTKMLLATRTLETLKKTLTPGELKSEWNTNPCLKEICDLIGPGTSYSRAELAELSYGEKGQKMQG